MGMVVMSKRELNRLDVLARLDSDRLTARAAAAVPRLKRTIVARRTERLPTRSAKASQRKLPITAPTPEESNMTVVAPKVRCQGFATKAITKLIRKKSRKSNICAAAETRNDV